MTAASARADPHESGPPPGRPISATVWPSRWSSSVTRGHAVVVSVLTPAEILIAAQRLAGARPHLAAVAGIVHPEDLWQLAGGPPPSSMTPSPGSTPSTARLAAATLPRLPDVRVAECRWRSRAAHSRGEHKADATSPGRGQYRDRNGERRRAQVLIGARIHKRTMRETDHHLRACGRANETGSTDRAADVSEPVSAAGRALGHYGPDAPGGARRTPRPGLRRPGGGQEAGQPLTAPGHRSGERTCSSRWTSCAGWRPGRSATSS